MRFSIKSMSVLFFLSIIVLTGCVAEKTTDNNTEINKGSKEHEMVAALYGESKSWRATVAIGVHDGVFVSKTEIKPKHEMNISSATITTIFENERYGQRAVTIANREMLEHSVLGEREFGAGGSVDVKATKDKVKAEVKLARVEIQWVYQGEAKKEDVVVQAQ
ncbi:hypothetical protein [Aneurinibacillus aneurinilyticus]|uniref:Lipoprotein n=2 Tax=Aneurinibacillus aneurinilyticus TaxID=1391 RepID=A0A848CY80_ANEAE|nr:hypothetical protein [Aneurinibacillus aneurinilyticus]MED0708401.1 hypothetical protein [Aneurinibacillus aneurinilyticus]MED0722532.1 hypothetical protein [Aneurinibacillus aneurinilyticus]MED0732465.1 hypothetical protein [Aneurinibacillus aneurinilyticus]MED0741918.1 hypothetical protein [Aneurinibacillus aneurinilyticus]NME98787.1 hypothetical protein [Aneurinibacillus aneurinilyticus]